jgi:hypothetical protein
MALLVDGCIWATVPPKLARQGKEPSQDGRTIEITIHCDEALARVGEVLREQDTNLIKT